MLKLFLWLKYLRKKKIVLLSVAAVALSCALLLVVASLFNSFIDAFEQSAVDAAGDIVLAPPARFSKYRQLVEKLEQLDTVKAATATLSVPGLLHLGAGNVRAVKILGIEPGRQAKVTGLKQALRRQGQLPGEPSFQIAGAGQTLGGFVGVGVVAEPDEETDEYDFEAIESMIGQSAILTTGAMIKTTDAARRFKRRAVKFIIADIVFTGIYFLDKNFVYLPIEDLQKKLYPGQDRLIAEQIQIKVTSEDQREFAIAQIRGVWEDFAADELGWSSYLIKDTLIVTSKQMQAPQVAEFRKQMGMLLLIFGVVSCSVILLVFCIFYMIVETCQKDIAIIKSCGATNISVASIFVGFGGCVGIVGSGLGVVLGYVVTKNINTIENWIRLIFGLKLWKSSVYMFSKIPNEMDWGSALPIILFAITAAALGSIIPAIVAVRIKPVDILRYE